MKIAVSSTEYLHIPVIPPDGVDLSAAPVQIAVLPVSTRTNPAPGDWHTATWADATTARLLIGPDGGVLALPAGSYRVWVDVDPAGAEHVIQLSGYLAVF